MMKFPVFPFRTEETGFPWQRGGLAWARAASRPVQRELPIPCRRGCSDFLGGGRLLSADKSGSDDRGAVLIVVLWILVALSMLALSFSASVRTEVNAARNTVDQKQSYYMARAGIEYATYKIMEAQSAFSMSQQLSQQLGTTPQVPPVFSGYLELALADGHADIQVIDETGKLNLNLASPFMIYNLLLMVGVDERQADVITDSIEDWRDQDDLYRPNGAEVDYYQGLEHPYFPKNGMLDVPEELLLIRGVTPEIYYGKKTLSEGTNEPIELYGLQKYFTTFTSITRINVNSAPIPVLAAIPGLDYDTAVRIAEIRDEAPISGIEEIMERIPGIPMEVTNFLSTMRSQVYTVECSGRMNNSEVVSRIRAVVRVGGSMMPGQNSYTVLYWNESNTEL